MRKSIKKGVAIALALMMLLACTSSAFAATKKLSSSTIGKLEFMTAVLGDYLQDGASDPFEKFDATKKQKNDFYTGVIYFYMFNVSTAKELLGDKAITGTSSEVADLLTLEESQNIFVSFFGSKYKSSVKSMMDKGYPKEDSKYVIGFSDGPYPTGKMSKYSIAKNGDVSATIKVTMDGEEQQRLVGTYKVVFTPNKSSMFGYSFKTISTVAAG